MSEELIVNFLQVIKDASEYLFSENHAKPYSWIGYICGYLRHYYPLEFLTAELNAFDDDIEKTISIKYCMRERKRQSRQTALKHSKNYQQN